jgi:hypothetical protein
MKAPLYLLALPRYEENLRASNARRPQTRRTAPAWPLRWPRKIATALPTSVRVFRKQMSTPLGSIDPGTRVISSKGRSLGVVRSIVVEVDSGFSAYAVSADAHDARVMLLPRHALTEGDDVAVVDDRLAERLLRRSA